MVLSAVIATLALAAFRADEPASGEEEAAAAPVEPPPAPPPPPEPAPIAPPRPEPRNADLRNGVIFSAERLFPLVTVQDLEKKPISDPVNCPVAIDSAPYDCPLPEPTATDDAVQLGPTWDAARSLFDFPALAVDGAVSGVTFGGSLVFGRVFGYRHVTVTGGDVEAAHGALGISPRIGYAATLGDGFALWPRLGVVVAITDNLKQDVNVLFVTAQLGGLWFFTRHAALALTPALHAPLTNERTNVRRFALDLGLTIAF